MPGFGTLVHEVLEIIDFTDADLTTEITEAVTDRLAWNPWPVDEQRLVAGLEARRPHPARSPCSPVGPSPIWPPPTDSTR